MTSQTLAPKPLSASPMICSPPSSNSLSRTLPQPSSITEPSRLPPPNLTMHHASQSHQDPLSTYTGQLLQFPLTGTALNDPRQLFRARSDLARLTATVDDRLRELGYCNEDWRRSIYAAGQNKTEEKA
ncbi:hypothetical protein BJX66DRAFT_295342 [Aspergillus keveii]|uniref:Uncharacterized protein n=1 Tax=Aspergillus keveii TaxID=714993 RepID=A0ABR4GHU6_9EURO